MASWMCIAGAAVFAITMLLGFGKKQGWGKLALSVGSLVVLLLLGGFGWWLTGFKEEKPPTAKEIAKEVVEKSQEAVIASMRSHLVMTGIVFSPLLVGTKMAANYTYMNEGNLDAKSKFPWMVAVDNVFLNDDAKQRQVEDRLFEDMLAKPRICPVLDKAP